MRFYDTTRIAAVTKNKCFGGCNYATTCKVFDNDSRGV
jgi:hypothetical protein